GLDGRVLMFAVAVAGLTALAFGSVPAILSARGDVHGRLKESARGTSAGPAGRRVRSILVATEIGLAVTLLVGASLLTRTFAMLVRQDPGFRPQRVVAASVELPASYQDFRTVVNFYERLLASIRSQPGVMVAGASNFLPLSAAWRGPFLIGDRAQP